MLDEPTNDLDMETLEVLEEMLGDYAGTVLLISHDRDFLDRIVSGVIAPEGNGRWVEYAGGYSDMLMQRGADVARDRRKPEPPKTSKASRAVQPRSRRPRSDSWDSRISTRWKRCQRRSRRFRPKPMRCRPSSMIRNSIPGTAPPSKKSRSRSADLQRKIAAAEEQWLELEILREDLAGG